MSDHLVFKMMQHEARFPTDRRYATNHMWAVDLPGGVFRFGFSAYAVRLMLDVYFLEWGVDEGDELALRQEIGAIETKKAESGLYAPIGGRLLRFNENLLSDPSAINVENYGAGWLFDMTGRDDGLLSPEEYLKHVASVWKVAQKTIRGI